MSTLKTNCPVHADRQNRVSLDDKKQGMKKLRFEGRSSLACRFITLLCLAPLASSNAYADIVTKLKDTSAITVWRIDQPNVVQPTTPYPQIKFLPGDRVNIDAGGCVQTGGMGLTWKLYVNPQGDNADRLYHGLIWIPGVNPGLERIVNFGLNKDYQIRAPLANGLRTDDLYLHLGYEDDQYSDNGYYSHDNGNNNQCLNVGNAWIVISIGHDGAIPPDASQFVGIPPAKFRCQAAWAFDNFDTPELSWDTFTNAFSLDFWDYIDPATYITYLAARGLASSGNCAGMALLSEVGEDQFVMADLKESFWSNYKQPSGSVGTDINTAHWEQLSTYFLSNWLGTVLNSPATNAATIERDLTKADYNYGLLTLENGTEGHVLVPLKVSHSGNQILIEVYDPNHPCAGIPDEGSYSPVVIDGDNWSFRMAGGTLWSGSGNGLGYIPYVGSDGWSDLGTNIAGALTIIFSSNTNVEQVSDPSGKKLFAANRPGVMDRSRQGFGRSVVRIPRFAQSDQKRPRTSGPRFTLDHARKISPQLASQGDEIRKEYESDYSSSGEIYLATDGKVSNLTFAVSSKDPAHPVRALIGRKGEFVEINISSANANTIHPSLVIHSTGDLNSGTTIQDRNGASLKVTFTHGLVSSQESTVTLQKTAEIPAATAPITLALTSEHDLQIFSSASLSPVTESTRVLGMQGEVKTPPNRQVTIQPPK
jgi:hypothetical protein